MQFHPTPRTRKQPCLKNHCLQDSQIATLIHRLLDFRKRFKNQVYKLYIISPVEPYFNLNMYMIMTDSFL